MKEPSQSVIERFVSTQSRNVKRHCEDHPVQAGCESEGVRDGTMDNGGK